MAYQVFTWSPDIPAQRKMKPSVHPIKFGDGYESRISSGINTMLAIWSVKFTADANTIFGYTPSGGSFIPGIESFLSSLGATTPFTWTDPLGNTGTYVCRAWDSSQIGFGVYELSGTFEQVMG
ncbi:phage tail protein [Ferrovum sp.]|uniref:phage tail protein n=1 Tax=Ferrovum sp. TaxID=2609467 RepID=UPI00262748BC|nr:phage tail protein [Ferrovum sp.]